MATKNDGHSNVGHKQTLAVGCTCRQHHSATGRWLLHVDEFDLISQIS